MNRSLQRLPAVVVALALLALVGCDLWVEGFRDWWDRHSLTGSVVSSLLVVAVTVLVVDQVMARRQRQDRATSVAVQGLIVFGQARRAYGAIVDTAADAPSSGNAAEELRTLASMVLTASPSLFDDAEARLFLAQVERLSVSMVRSLSASSATADDDRARLSAQMSQLQACVAPLVARIPAEERSALEGDATA